MINSSNVIDIGVAISLQNNFSNQSKRISSDYNAMVGEIRKQAGIIEASSGTLASGWMNVIGGMAKAYDYSVGVQREIWMASKISKATASEETELLQMAKDINERTPLTAKDVASSMRYLAMAGFNAQQVKDITEPVAQLATILGANPGGKGGVADLMTNIMATYGINAKNAASTADDLYTAVTSANISLDDLAQSITYAGSYANIAGVSLRETAAAIGALGNQGIQGSRAGVALANMFNYLMQSISGARPQGKKMLDAVGIKPEDLLNSEGKLKSLANTFQVLNKVLGQLNAEGQIYFLKEVMQVRATRATVGAYMDSIRDMANGGKVFKRIMDQYDQNAGIVGKTVDDFNKKNFGKLEAFKSSLENLVVTFGEAMEKFTPLVGYATKLVDGVQSLLKSKSGTVIVTALGMVAIANVLRQGFLTIVRVGKLINLQFAATKANLRGSVTNTGVWTKGVQSLNGQWAIMEGHLVNILRMMGQMTVMQARMMGFRFVRRKDGAIDLRDSKGKIRGIWGSSLGDYLAMGMMAGAMGGGATAAGAAAGAATSTTYGRYQNFTKDQVRSRYFRMRYGRFGGLAMGASGALSTAGTGILRGLSGIAALFGGPWGIGIATTLYGIQYLIQRQNEIAEETQAIAAETMNRITPDKSVYGLAMKEAIKELYNEGNRAIRMDIRINGDRYGIVEDGGVLNYDANSLNDPFMLNS